MRELTVRVRFTKASLGNVKRRDNGGSFLLPRNPQGYVTFMSSWHHANMRFAASLLGRHQDEVEGIYWDIMVDGLVLTDSWYRRYYSTDGGRRRFALHESFMAGQEVGFNCAMPPAVSDEDFWRLMAVAGQYRGLSPYRPGEYGFFEVVGLLPRRRLPESESAVEVKRREPGSVN